MSDQKLKLDENRTNYNLIINSPYSVAKAFDLIDIAFSEISDALAELSISFFDKNWNLNESLQTTLTAYKKAADIIRNRLTIISMMNNTISRYLLSETRPIPLKKNTAEYIDLRTTDIEKQLKLYYKDVRGTNFPRFDNEIKEHKKSIGAINANIDQVNKINSAHSGYSKLRHAKQLSI